MRSLVFAAALLVVIGSAVFPGPARGEPRAPGSSAQGRRPADFTLESLEGKPVSLRQFLGRKPVLLVFWATWCPECNAAIPAINALHEGPDGKRVQILALDFRETKTKVAAAVKSREIRYTVLLDERGEVARAFEVVGIPTYVLIARDGTIVYRANTLPQNLSGYL